MGENDNHHGRVGIFSHLRQLLRSGLFIARLQKLKAEDGGN
jgi:hypothetical protein